MVRPINLVLFGDQTVEKLSSIRSLVRHSKDSATARRFLREATDNVQLNLSKLSKQDFRWDHDVSTLLGLAEDNIAENNPNGIIATILMCIGRLGELLVFAEEDPSILGSENGPVQVLAYCTGLLPASALVAARDTSELFEIAKEIISITFRMAYAITQRMRLIEDTTSGWAITVAGTTPGEVQPILDEFHQIQSVPFPRRIAIGIVSSGWLTLIGAPSSIVRLMEFSKKLKQLPRVETDTNGPVHTKYLPRFDMDYVLGDSSVLDIPITSKAKMISPASCKPYAHNTLRSLLEEILVDIAHNILRINETADELILGLQGKGPISLTVAGPTGHLSTFQRTLRDNGFDHQIRQHKGAIHDKVSRGGSDLIAIVGMAGRFPGSDTVEAFFDDLLEGKTHIKRIPKSRFDLDVYYDPTSKKRNSTTAQHGAFLERPGYFDNRLFNISPREAAQMDPIQRLLLTTSYEALEDAGYSRNGTLSTENSRIATYFGQAAEDWRDTLNNNDIDIYYVPSLSRPFGPGRLAYHHKWGGGTYALDTACSTSTTAIHLACQALNGRECDTAVAGGGSITTSPSSISGLSKSGMASTTGGCRTYHDDADGYARAEGIGIVILKRLEDALADNDNIHGVIRGSARTYTSTSKSITHPCAESQARIYEEVLRQTSVIPHEVAYVEMHGTGTQAGDLAEMTSVIKVMGQERSRSNVLTVGAVKANIGHGEAAAGVTALIKVLMMMRERKIPTQPGLPFKLNRNFSKLDTVPLQIAGMSKDMVLKPSPTAADGKIKCMVNSFDASGGNTSLVIEQAPELPVKDKNPLPSHVICISAKTTAALQNNRKRLLDHLIKNPDTEVADLAYTTTARRMHEVLRVAYTGSSTKEIISKLREDVDKGAPNDPKTKPAPVKIIFAFTGQGSHYAGMGKQLFQHSLALRARLYTYQQMAQCQGLPSFLHLISDDKFDIVHTSTVCVQLATVALEIAVAELLQSWGMKPDAVIGHSLGEYSALCVAGVLSVSDTLFLVGRRAHLMESHLEIGEFAMLALGKDLESTRQLLTSGKTLDKTNIACINAPQLTVVSGPMGEIQSLKFKAEQEDYRATELKVPYGFHSHHIEPILGEFEKITKGIVFSTPTIPVASTLLGKLVEVGNDHIFSSSYLARQARECVNFVAALEALNDAGFAKEQTHWCEIGPEAICIGMVRRTLNIPAARLLSTMKSAENNWTTLSSTLAALYESGVTIDWPRYYEEFKSSVSLLALPKYAFDEKDYWTSFVEPKILHAGPAQDSGETSSMTAIKPTISTFSTTSLQCVESEKIQDRTIFTTFASRTSDPSLYDAIQGHAVNGLKICSLSIFCDMAKSAAQYAYTKLNPTKKVPVMTVSNMDMIHALVVDEIDPDQIVRTGVIYSASSNRATITFHSANKEVQTEHGSCEIIFEDSHAWFSQFSHMSFLMNARIQSLKDMSSTGSAHRLLKPVVYKLFDNLVTYGKEYQGMEEVWIDAQCRDAVSTVKLYDSSGARNFLYNPFWIDAASHVAGFLVNGGLKYPEDIACLSTGFESWHLLEELQADTVYMTYVSMQETADPNKLSGAAYVYNQDQKLIQVTTGIKFQKMKKVVLNSLLQPGKSSTNGIKKGRSQPEAHIIREKLSKAPSSEFSTPESQFDNHFQSDTEGNNDGTATPASSINENKKADLLNVFLNIVASESGYVVKDMKNDTAFADMGMDSLMAITIIAAVRAETGFELPATFLLDNPTVGDAELAFNGEHRPEPISVPTRDLHQLQETFLDAEVRKPIIEPPVGEAVIGGAEDNDKLFPLAPEPVTTGENTVLDRTSKVILLQGSPLSMAPNLFLLPDGSGSPSRYIQLPALGDNINVYGLESPFLKDPTELKCSTEAMCGMFLAAIKTVQPTGGYMLGGFSLGAIYAYEVSRMLLEANEQVDRLLIIDMAVPASATAELSPTHDQLKEAGLVSPIGRSTTAQKDHLTNTVRSISKYEVKPSSSGRSPTKTVLISSKQGSAVAGESKLAQWARGETTASRGWDNIVKPVKVYEIDAEHHSLFRLPAIKAVGRACKDAIIEL